MPTICVLSINMKNIRVFLSENFQFLEVKFSIYLNRRVFIMISSIPTLITLDAHNELELHCTHVPRRVHIV